MATKPVEIQVVRHTWDRHAKQWVNVIRKVTKDDKYKSKGTDPYGNKYHDTEVDYVRDYPLLKKLGVDMPMSEFKQLAHAAFGFGADKDMEEMYVDATERGLLGQLHAKRAEGEASKLKPGPERDKRLRLAGAMATGSDAYASAIKRNAPAGRAKAYDAADRHRLLGEIQGMIGQEPGADTRLKTLDPLLVGYIRNATPQQIQTMSNNANAGNLDAILKDVGVAAKGWEQDPDMQQYPFAAAANRYNSPTYKEDLAEQQEAGKLANVDQRQTVNPVYEPVGSPSQNTTATGQQGQPQEQQPTTEQQGTTNAPWTAPSKEQYKPAQQQPQAKPGDYGNTLGAMASNWGQPQRQIMFPYPRDPGIPPKMSDYGAYIAAPTNQAALSQAFQEYSDIVRYYKVQVASGMVDKRVGDAAVNQAEQAYRQVKDRLVHDANLWKEKLVKETTRKAPVVNKRTNYTYPEQTDELPGEGGSTDGRSLLEKDFDLVRENATDAQRDQFIKLGAEAFKSMSGAVGASEEEKNLIARAKSAPRELQKLSKEINTLLLSMGADGFRGDTTAERVYQLATNKSALRSRFDQGKQKKLRDLLHDYKIWSNVYHLMLEEYPEEMDEEDEERASGKQTGKYTEEEDHKRHTRYAKVYHRLMKGRWYEPGASALAHKYAHSKYKELGIHNHEQWLYYMDTGNYPARDGANYYKNGGPKD